MDMQELQLVAADAAKTVLMKTPDAALFIIAMYYPRIGSVISGNVPPDQIQAFLSVVSKDLHFIGAQGIEEN